jgi:tetratricopeptide (TPR) repeat protein
LCASYEQLFLDHLQSSCKRQLESALWKNVFYRIIEDFRKRLRRVDSKSALTTGNQPAGKQTTSEEFLEFLKDSVKWYTGLNERLCIRYPSEHLLQVLYPDGKRRRELETIATATKSATRGSSKEMFDLAVQLCHRNCIYVGDLMRYYEQTVTSSGDYSRAIAYYQKAIRLVPQSGNPLNQLAVVSTYRSDLLAALAYYYQSLTVGQPFATTRENLAVLFQKNRRAVSSDSTVNDGQWKHFRANFITLHQAVFEDK